MGNSSSQSTISFKPNSEEQCVSYDFIVSPTYNLNKFQFTILFIQSKSILHFYLDYFSGYFQDCNFHFIISNGKQKIQTVFFFSTEKFVNSLLLPENFINDDVDCTIKISIQPLGKLEYEITNPNPTKDCQIRLLTLNDMKAANIFDSGKFINVSHGTSLKSVLLKYDKNSQYEPFVVFPGLNTMFHAPPSMIISNYIIPNHEVAFVLLPKEQGENQQLYVSNNILIGSYSPENFKNVQTMFINDGPKDHSIVQVMPTKMNLLINGEVTKAAYNTAYKDLVQLITRNDSNTLLLADKKATFEQQFPTASYFFHSKLETFEIPKNVNKEELIDAKFIQIHYIPYTGVNKDILTFYHIGETYKSLYKRLEINGNVHITPSLEKQNRFINDNDMICEKSICIYEFPQNFVVIRSKNDLRKVHQNPIVLLFAEGNNPIGLFVCYPNDDLRTFVERIEQQIGKNIQKDQIFIFSKGNKDCIRFSTQKNILNALQSFKFQGTPIVSLPL